MEIDPSTTADVDQLMAALRDVPQEVLGRFEGGLTDLALALYEGGIPLRSQLGFLHGCLAETMLRLQEKTSGEP